MKPGRFVSVWFIALGALMFLQYWVAVALGEVRFQVSLYSLGSFLPGLGALYVGLDRLRHPGQEEWPAEYGLWTYGAALFLVVATGWLLYSVYSDYLAPL